MQVKSSEAMNGRYVCLYGLFAFLYLLAILLPIRWFPAWPVILGTVVLVVAQKTNCHFLAVLKARPSGKLLIKVVPSPDLDKKVNKVKIFSILFIDIDHAASLF